MTTVRQEVAAILFDYAQQMSDQTYQNILQQLAEITDSRDPQDTKVYLDRISGLEETNEILGETLIERDEYVTDLEYQLSEERSNRWGETPLEPPNYYPSTSVPQEILDLSCRYSDIYTESSVWPGLTRNQSPEEHSSVNSCRSFIIAQQGNLSILEEKYKKIWQQSSILQINNDHLRLHRNQEYEQLKKQLKQEREINASIHKQYLTLITESLGDISFSCDDLTMALPYPVHQWMGTYHLLPNVESNYCPVYQLADKHNHVYLYNTNNHNSMGIVVGREWIIADTLSKRVYYRMRDTSDSYLPTPSNRWYLPNTNGQWVNNPSLRISYQNPFRVYRTNTINFPNTANWESVYGPDPKQTSNSSVWDQNCLGLSELMSE